MAQDETVKKQIAELRATGKSIRKIAEVVPPSPSTVCRILKQEDVQELVEHEQAIFLQALPNARQNIQSLIENYATLSDKEKDLAWKSSMEMLRGVGLLPSNNLALIFQQLNIFANKDAISPQIQKILDTQLIDVQDT